MKKAISAVLVLLCVFCLVGCSRQQQIEGKQLLAEGSVTKVEVSSEPQGYRYSFLGEAANAVVDYLSGLSLIKTENPWMTGMSWVISLEYDDGTALTVYHCGEYIVADNNWYKITNDAPNRFDNLLSVLREKT